MNVATPLIFLFAMLALPLATQSSAQQTAYVVGSTVTGHVVCADTNAPARFAKVLLKSTVPSHTGEDFMKSLQNNLLKASAKTGSAPAKPMTAEQQQALAAAAKGMNQVTDMLNSSTVGIDGAYSFAGVKPGTYYVHAIYPGYIDPVSELSDEDFSSTDPAVRARIAQIPTVTIGGTDSAHANVRLERGAAISGRILFDDGSPASGWMVSVVKPKSPEDPGDAAAAAMAPALAMSGAVQVFKTDDLGRYRISGLKAGEYALRANLIATATGISASNIADGGSGINIAVYSGDTFSRVDAKSVKLVGGDEQAGIDITIPSRTLHNITGHVYAKSDGHTLNVGGVSLTSQQNPALHLKAAVRDDGSFHFEYLPGGNYTLTIDDAAEGRHKASAASFMGMNLPDTEILKKYGSDSTVVALGDSDVDSARLTVVQTDWTPPAKSDSSPDVSPADLINGLLGGDSNDKPKP
jgi:hypothetical protein